MTIVRNRFKAMSLDVVGAMAAMAALAAGALGCGPRPAATTFDAGAPTAIPDAVIDAEVDGPQQGQVVDAALAADGGSSVLAILAAARAAYLSGATAIDLTGDGTPDWFLSARAPGGLAARESIDFDHNGVNEWTLTRSPSTSTTTIAFDHAQTGVPDVLDVHTIDSSGTVTAVTTTYSGITPKTRRTLTTPMGSALSVEMLETYDSATGHFVFVSSTTVSATLFQASSNVLVDPSCPNADVIREAFTTAEDVGIPCLDSANAQLSSQVSRFLAGNTVTIACGAVTPGACAESDTTRVDPIFGATITLDSSCSNPLAATLFHEILHFVVPVDPALHNVPGASDPVYGCDYWCFGGSGMPMTDLCRRQQCNNNACGDTNCLSGCDPASGECTGATPIRDNKACYEASDTCSLCKDGQCNAGSSALCDDGSCVDTNTNDANCGVCGKMCRFDERCQGGSCVCNVDGLTDCPDAHPPGCFKLQADPQHCGGCLVDCTHPSGGAPGACCNGSCADLSADPNNCGKCGNACQAGQSCVAGQCTGCTTGQTLCGGICTDTQIDAKNCGACGNSCGSGQSCQKGVCLCSSNGCCCGANQQCNFAAGYGFFCCGPGTNGFAVGLAAPTCCPCPTGGCGSGSADTTTSCCPSNQPPADCSP
jgi:hypothetical protein